MDELLQEFIAETRETLEALAGEIVAWESDPTDRGRLDAIFRFVHTVKGSCGFLDLPRLERLSHAAEDVLATVRAGTRTPDKRLVDAVLAIVDRIGEIVEAIDAGASLDDSSEELLIAALSARPDPEVQDAAVSRGGAARAPTRSVRLSVDLLDRMMSGMSEMVLARNELARRLRDEGADPRLEAALDRLSGTVAEMRDTVTRTRMQKIEALFSPLPRMVRDTAAQLGRQVTLQVDGSDVELDREMIEMMRDPLVHMVRNAIDHGIEPPAERLAAGKPAAGRLCVAARQSGNRIIIEISDDGRGIDTDRLVAKLEAMEPGRAPALRALSAAARTELVFEPGLSSRDAVTSISGRGVGMDVVRANVEQIGGRIALANRPGEGLSVSVEVPLTLAILSAVVVAAGDQRFAIPRVAVNEIVGSRGEAIRIDPLGDGMLATIRERRLPLLDVREVLGLVPRGETAPMMVIVDVPGGGFALGVDAVLDTEELVVKPAAPAVMAVGVYAGQTLPDTGVPMLLLDCAGIAQRADLSFGREAAAVEDVAEEADPGTAALLFEDVDGMRRAIALAAIDRIDRIPAGTIVAAGGRFRLVVQDRALPLVAVATFDPARPLGVLRLHDDMGEIGYVMRDAADIVRIAGPVTPVPGPGPILGVTVIDGEAIEIVDPLWVLAQRPVEARSAAPTCRLAGAQAGWMRVFLAPALEAAGYRLVEEGAADVTLAMAGDAVEDGDAVVTLSRDRDAGVYCYDRAGVVATLAARLGAHR